MKIKLFALALLCLQVPLFATNFVVFLADDLGWGDLEVYGHPRIKTPHLNQFAKEGVKLTQCYSANGVCSPSRSAILTGRVPYRNGVFRWIPEWSHVHLRESEIAFPKLLREKWVRYLSCWKVAFEWLL